MTGGATERPATLDHLRSRKKALTLKVPIITDGEIANAWGDADEAFNQAKFAHDRAVERGLKGKALAELDATLTAATAALDELRPAVEECTFEFVFTAIGRRAFEDLVKDHPPKADDVAKAKADDESPPTWNGDTFPQALVAASMSTPRSTLDEVTALWNDPNWNAPELLALWAGALAVNQQRRVADLGKGSGTTRS